MLLISTMLFLFEGIQCKEFSHSANLDDIAALDLKSKLATRPLFLVGDPTISCDFGYLHRKQVLVTGLCTLFFCCATALNVNVFALNHIASPSPRRWMPTSSLFHLFVVYSLVLVDVFVSNPHTKARLSTALCVFVLVQHVIIQPGC